MPTYEELMSLFFFAGRVMGIVPSASGGSTLAGRSMSL